DPEEIAPEGEARGGVASLEGPDLELEARLAIPPALVEAVAGETPGGLVLGLPDDVLPERGPVLLLRRLVRQMEPPPAGASADLPGAAGPNALVEGREDGRRAAAVEPAEAAPGRCRVTQGGVIAVQGDGAAPGRGPVSEAAVDAPLRGGEDGEGLAPPPHVGELCRNERSKDPAPAVRRAPPHAGHGGGRKGDAAGERQLARPGPGHAHELGAVPHAVGSPRLEGRAVGLGPRGPPPGSAAPPVASDGRLR